MSRFCTHVSQTHFCLPQLEPTPLQKAQQGLVRALELLAHECPCVFGAVSAKVCLGQ